jgi:hypothetical protein
MGLDIYLYKYQDFEKTQRLEKEYEEFSEKLWEGLEYDSLSQEKKDELRGKEKEFAASLGLDEWGDDKTGKERIEDHHPDYPEHYFMIGYFRSSYNEGGIERILRNLELPTMHDIFQKEDEEYVFQPDWHDALIRVTEVIEKFKEKGAYRVHHVSGNIFSESEIKSEAQALAAFTAELSRENPLNSNYSNKTGEFYVAEPLRVLAMLPGKSKLLRERDCIYVVTESDNSWYTQALEIVKATCEFVLAQADINQYYLHWSG